MNLFPYLAFVELLYDVEPFLFLLFIFWEISFYKIKYLKNEVRTFCLDAQIDNDLTSWIWPLWVVISIPRLYHETKKIFAFAGLTVSKPSWT